MENIVQTGIRMDADLLESLKMKARQERLSLNAYMVNVLEAAVRPMIPKLRREDFEGKLDADELAIPVEIPQELIDNDPKIARLLSI